MSYRKHLKEWTAKVKTDIYWIREALDKNRTYPPFYNPENLLTNISNMLFIAWDTVCNQADELTRMNKHILKLNQKISRLQAENKALKTPSTTYIVHQSDPYPSGAGGTSIDWNEYSILPMTISSEPITCEIPFISALTLSATNKSIDYNKRKE